MSQTCVTGMTHNDGWDPIRSQAVCIILSR